MHAPQYLDVIYAERKKKPLEIKFNELYTDIHIPGGLGLWFTATNMYPKTSTKSERDKCIHNHNLLIIVL